jgi:diguanylate cyclase (GGDEF)-like protein/PAS domain S-box-containing protein
MKDLAGDKKIVSIQRALAHRDTQITLLKEIVSAISQQLGLDRILALVAEHARTLVNAETLLIPVVDDERKTYTYRAGSGRNATEIVGERLDLEMGICGWVWRNQRPWWRGTLDELSEEERVRWETEAGDVLLVPLVGRYTFLGGIAAINKRGDGDFDRTDLDLLSMLADWTVVAIDNSSLIEKLDRTNIALHEQNERVETTLASIGDAVITTDQKGVVDYVNPAAERMLNLPTVQAIGQPLEALFSLTDETSGLPSDNPVLACQRDNNAVGLFASHVLTRRDGMQLYVESTASPVHRQGGRTGAVLVLHDVTKTRELSLRVAHQATHDSLTDLINRREFEARLQRALASARQHHREHALLYVDLDQFKLVNDTCGHVAGDELLRQVSAQIGDAIRRHDTLARLGGDEFGLLLEDCPQEQALRIADNLREVVEAMRFTWQDKVFRTTASIGLVSLNRHSPPLEDLLAVVDAACYMAKERGRNRIHVHDERDEDLLRRHSEMQWAPRIAEAIERNRLVLYQQSVMPLRKRGEAGAHYEILVRMLDDQGNIVSPGIFLPTAERYSLVASIDRWVVQAVLAELARHPRHLERLALCSINLSGQSLGSDQLLPHIERMLRDTGVPAHKLCFEITETEAIANLSRARQFMSVLRAMGCRFALDDFGTGFSSYGYLKNLPVDFIKIDGAFVKDLTADPVSQAMVESINQVGHALGKQTIAEFVEDKATLACLENIGVDYAQGYGIAMPRPIGELFRTG